MRRGGRKQDFHCHRSSSSHEEQRWVKKPLETTQVENSNSSSRSHASSSSSAFDSISQSMSSPSKHPRGNTHRYGRGGFSKGVGDRELLVEEEGESSNINSHGDTSELNSSSIERKDDTEKEGVPSSDEGFNGVRAEGSNSASNVVDIADRLRTLQLEDEEEREMQEELLGVNDQLQEDELLAMESIYDDNFSIFESANGLKSFQIRVHVEAPEKITFTTNSGNNNDMSYTFKVEYIPPIILTCLLPKSYPSNHPPYFIISVQWLNSNKISELCSMLDSIWKEQAGQEIVYQWVDWLQNSALSHLCLNSELTLGPYNSGYVGGDKRAVSGSISPERDIPALKRYNDDRVLHIFNRNLHDCYICFSQLAGSEFVRLPCQHFFCLKCLKTYASMHVKEGTLSNLICPDTKCKDTIQPGLLKQLLDDGEFERWESLLLYKTLQAMSDVMECPRCETPCILDEVRNDAQCSKCFYSFCTLCRDKRHVAVECMSAEMKLRILQERQVSGVLKDQQKRREQDMINELLSVKEILRDAKQCPVCQLAISRTEGCNKMVCSNCGSYFCYRCNKKIDGYDHFGDGSCELFPQEMIDDWEGQMNIRQINFRQINNRGRMANGPTLAQAPTLNHLCPICGQRNVKVGNNNHILCWACQNHYCYLCKSIVKRCSEHFGPKSCKQHTEE
ncbi:E3 ubiquitin-protein ligase RNF14-like [Impatiens glandulifera]|uniref:E3 ubiquitin-protein ligase RNF14-like n=1 Tax=Impatiens glandulifera TaxID=253017 RepID=UPI001FB067E6|nr:E3 ubiquitin-protein ligase RNF14-like [Impatiens glandulifera]